MSKQNPDQYFHVSLEDSNPESQFWALLGIVRKIIRTQNYDREKRQYMKCLKVLREADYLLYDPKTGAPILDADEHVRCSQAFLALRSLVM